MAQEVGVSILTAIQDGIRKTKLEFTISAWNLPIQA